MRKIIILLLIIQSYKGISQDYQTYITPFLQSALEKNPAISAAALELKASENYQAQASVFPDPAFVLSWFGNIMPKQALQQTARISYMQAIPWFNQVKTQKNLASVNTEKAELNYLYTVQNVFLELYKSFFDLYYRKKQIEWLQINYKLMQQRKDWVNASYITGKTSLVSALLLDILLLDLHASIENKQAEILTIESNFIKLIGDDSIKLELPAILLFPELDKEHDSLINSILEYNLRLKISKTQIQLAEYLSILEQKKYAPSLSLGIEYNLSSTAEHFSLPMPMISVKLPLRRKIYAQTIAAKNHEFEASIYQFENEKMRLLQQFENLWTSYQNNHNNWKTSQEILIINEQALALMQSSVLGNEATFADWVYLQEKYINTRLNQLSLENEIRKNMAEIQFMQSF
jgi:outer membrane protein TolC